MNLATRTSTAPLLALATFVAFALLAYAQSRGVLAALDHGLLAWFAALRGPLADRFFLAVTWLGSGYALAPAAALLVAFFALRRKWSAAWLLGVTYFGASVCTWALKLAIARERPDLYPAATLLPSDWSFPSGHATHAAAFALGVWLLLREGRLRVHPAAALGLGALALLAAASRLHLQVHWPSDVLAGALVAVFWAALAASGARLFTISGGKP